MAQQTIRVGTTLWVKGTIFDDYVVERIRSRRAADGTTSYTIEARTVRQRCFPRALSGFQVFDDAYIRDCVAAGSMEIRNDA